jgi:hypothetical protein
MPLDPLDFVSQANAGKLDSRVKETSRSSVTTHSIYALERTFCVVCGKEKGWVSQTSSKYIAASNIIVICDRCELLFGNLPLRKADIHEVDISKGSTTGDKFR